MSTEVATAQSKEETLPMTAVGMSRQAGSFRVSPENLGEVVKFAQLMARAGEAIPPHLRDKPGACMAVAMQAFNWQLDPFAVANKSYFVNNRLAFEAQLIAAVVNTRSGIEGRLKYRYEGDGDKLTCFVNGRLDGDDLEYESPLLGSISPKNSPLWKTDPKQQLGYYSARAWARRHCPEVILGVYDRDEAAAMKDVTPANSGLAERLNGGEGGFSAEHVTKELDAPTETAVAEPAAA